ncbi:Membrane-associated protease RseP [Pseudomonas syringae pv. actinidiae]|uniref:Membrane-associated protease RseP n=1 Tax=Pseudomonas syringae pv. actinidiae TaxID=103796 RepID=A0AAN4PZS5_PSESF|nr:Membrane-associated protease RseP [Pseudomonas syringae pv. actinidiae]
MTHLFEQNHGGAHCTPSFAWSVKWQAASLKRLICFCL